MPVQLTQAVVSQWLTLVKGKFSVRDIWAELGIESSEGKNYLRVILGRLEGQGIISQNGTGNTYRKIDSAMARIDWESADPNATLPIKFPFGIHEFCKIYPKSIIIVAGSKNEGKTAFLMSCIMPNASHFVIDFFNSETGPEQLKTRFTPLDIPSPAPFNVYERYDNFADVVDPTHLAIIDYLDFNSDVYLVGTEIDSIFRKLTTGVAIIGLQKPPPTKVVTRSGSEKWVDRDLAYGGGFSAKRACLYISLSSHKLKLVYVKTPAQPRVSPNNMTWSYDFDDTGYFTNIQRSYGNEIL